MPSTDRKLELKAKTSVAQAGSQPFVYAKALIYVDIVVDVPYSCCCHKSIILINRSRKMYCGSEYTL
jgi:hypothetical protein